MIFSLQMLQFAAYASVFLKMFSPTEHEEKQNRLRALRNRQDLFQEEGILNLILEAIDKINVITSQGFLVALARDESGHSFEIISAYLYQLLGIIICQLSRF